jgi:hypothetical protein
MLVSDRVCQFVTDNTLQAAGGLDSRRDFNHPPAPAECGEEPEPRGLRSTYTSSFATTATGILPLRERPSRREAPSAWMTSWQVSTTLAMQPGVHSVMRPTRLMHFAPCFEMGASFRCLPTTHSSAVSWRTLVARYGVHIPVTDLFGPAPSSHQRLPRSAETVTPPLAVCRGVTRLTAPSCRPRTCQQLVRID